MSDHSRHRRRQAPAIAAAKGCPLPYIINMHHQAEQNDRPALTGIDFTPPAQAEAIIAALDCGDDQARYVGGAVRDHLLGRPLADIDIATTMRPQNVMQRLQDSGFNPVASGIEYGTVSVFIPRQSHANSNHHRDTIEITTLRADVKTDGRYAVVSFGRDWHADAFRRDFTINALYLDRHGQLFDPTGCGRADLAARRVRFIGDAQTRIREDYLRILRYFRFQACYDTRPALNQAILAICRRNSAGLARLSRERIRDELLKIIIAPRAVIALDAMVDTDILSRLLPVKVDRGALQSLVTLEKRQFLRPDPLLRLGILIGSAQAVDPVAAKLALSKAQKRRLVALHRVTPILTPELSYRQQRRLLARYGQEILLDRLRKTWSLDETHCSRDYQWQAMMQSFIHSRIPVFPINGNRLRDAGLTSGPQLGSTLVQLRNWWIDHDFPADPDRLDKAINNAVADLDLESGQPSPKPRAAAKPEPACR